MKKDKKILVTGGAGFIGSHIVRRLLNDGHSVVVLTREGSNMRRLQDLFLAGSRHQPNLEIIKDDLSNFEHLRQKLQVINPSGVVHCAASNIKSGVSAPEDELVNVNFSGTVHLLRALEGIKYSFFINCGSYLEYGTHEHPLCEDYLCRPVEIYAITKLAATLYCQSVAKSKGAPILTFRIFSPYGPQMEAGRLFYEVIQNAYTNKDIKLTKPETKRDFIFIDDIANLFIEAMDKADHLKGEIFNLGYGQARTIKDLVDSALKNTSSKSHIIWGGAKDVAYDQGCQEADMKKTFAAFNWRPSHDLNAGVIKMVRWLESSI